MLDTVREKIKMIVFKLTMSGVGSWNGRWSGEGKFYAKAMYETSVPRNLWGKSFFYRWDDGYEACVDILKMPFKEARKMERKSNGLFRYDWMIRSIIKKGYIDISEARI